MAQFYPSFDEAQFTSEGEFTLFRDLQRLDDDFVVIHSLPWLRGSVRRVFSKELREYVDVYRNERKNLTGEIDFVVLHPVLGILCIEVKSGSFKPRGPRFVRESTGEAVDPLEQVKDNAFTLMESLKGSGLKCPVGYAIYFPDMDFEGQRLSSAFHPVAGHVVDDGILILRKHVVNMTSRIHELMRFWKRALAYPESRQFARETSQFLEAVWPEEIRTHEVGRKISADGLLWLRLDKIQEERMAACLKKDRQLIAGFSGSGKTLIARALAEEFAVRGKRVLILFKNRLISQHTLRALSAVSKSGVTVQTFHAFCEKMGAPRRSVSDEQEPNYEEHYQALLGKVDNKFDVLVIDEAQALSENDHLALRAYFTNANTYLFADVLQIMEGIESGSSYEFLTATYNCPIYFLSNVYRSPAGVTQRMLEMTRPEHHEVTNVRPQSKDDFQRKLSWDIRKSIADEVERHIGRGAKRSDIVVLTHFNHDLAPPGVSQHSISAYRGMEAPVVIVAPSSQTDDTALACAIGRATTKAIVMVEAEMRLPPIRVGSSFILAGLEGMSLDDFAQLDMTKDVPVLVENSVKKYSKVFASHSVGGAEFSYSPVWKMWLVADGYWPTRCAQLWGWVLERTTGAEICGVDSTRNLVTTGYLRSCLRCSSVTPHHPLTACIPCRSPEVDEETVARIAGSAEQINQLKLVGLQSLVNTAALVEGFVFPDFQPLISKTPDEMDLFLARVIVEYRMRSKKMLYVTKMDISRWLHEVLVESDLNGPIEKLVGKTISSLCSSKKIKKIAEHTYLLLEKA